MPFIQPIEPIELPFVFDLQNSILDQNSSHEARLSSDPTPNSINYPSTQSNSNNNWKGKAIVENHASNNQSTGYHRKNTSQEEAVIEKTRMELERKIGELNQLKNQLAQTEKRERELASRCVSWPLELRERQEDLCKKKITTTMTRAEYNQTENDILG